MPRGLFFIMIAAVLLIGGLILLSTRATEAKTIEVDVAAPANAS